MNKQRYLAELSRLLVFMTDEDRELTVRHYAELFDAAGEDGADRLVTELGSPTKAAIGLSRGYEPGKLTFRTPEAGKAEKRETAPAPVQAARMNDEPWDDLPSFELPTLPLDEEPEEKETAPETESAEEDEPKTLPEIRPVRAPRKTPEEAAAEAEPWRDGVKTAYERSMPLGLGAPLFVLVMAALGIPVAAVFIALMAVLLAPGCACVFAAYLAAVGGLWCLAYIADAVMMFGLAFLILAVGVLVLWVGFRLDVMLAGAYVKGVRWLAGELLGRKVTDDENA